MPTPGEADGETIVVKITGKGIDLERKLGIDALPRLMAFLFSGEGAIRDAGVIATYTTGYSMSPHLHVGAMERPVGAVEYLRDKRPQTSSDTILVLAGFLELHENRRPFSRDDIRRMIRAGRLPEPANLPRDSASPWQRAISSLLGTASSSPIRASIWSGRPGRCWRRGPAAHRENAQGRAAARAGPRARPGTCQAKGSSTGTGAGRSIQLGVGNFFDRRKSGLNSLLA